MERIINNITKVILLGMGIIVFTIIVVWGGNGAFRVYKIWASKKDGQAELAQAEYNRRIKIYEARAFEESAKHLAQAEVERAKGVAAANKIIGDSLQGNEAYLRYLWIQGLQTNKMNVVYIPTEASLPILEANRWGEIKKNKNKGKK